MRYEVYREKPKEEIIRFRLRKYKEEIILESVDKNGDTDEMILALIPGKKLKLCSNIVKDLGFKMGAFGRIAIND